MARQQATAHRGSTTVALKRVGLLCAAAVIGSACATAGTERATHTAASSTAMAPSAEGPATAEGPRARTEQRAETDGPPRPPPDATQAGASAAPSDAASAATVSSEAYRALLEAELALQSGDVPSAVVLLREATVHDPASAYLALRLAEGLLEAGSPDEARRAAEAALALAPDLIAALRVVGSSQLAAGDTEGARSTLETALTRAPSDKPTATMLAELLAEAGDLDGAERVIDRFVAHAHQANDVTLALARVFAERGRPERALIHVERALSTSPGDAQALALQMTLLWALGRFEQALPVAQELARTEGDAPDVRRDLLTAHALAGRLDEARGLASAWLEDDASMELRLLVSEAWERAGVLSEAASTLEGAMSSGAGPAPIRAELARLALDAGNAQRAAAAACAATPAGSAPPAVVASLVATCGRAWLKQGRAAEAHRLLAERTPTAEDAGPLLELLADVAAAEGIVPEEANAFLEAALRTMPADAPDAGVLDAAARVHEALGAPAAARAALDEALRRRPSDPDLLFALARHLERSGAPGAAAEIVERVMDRGREGIAELNFVAFTLAEAGSRLEDAQRLAWRALVQDPLNGYVMDTLGWCVFMAGDVQTAAEILRRAVRLVPGDGEVLFHLATVEARAGDGRAATTALRRALELLDKRHRVRGRAEALRRTLEGGS